MTEPRRDPRMRVGFVARNGFQAQHVAGLCLAAGGTIVTRPAMRRAIAARHPGIRVLGWRWPWSWLDRRFDLLVFQGASPAMAVLRHARPVLIQYGYAKARYNYGDWRGLADLNICYGPDAAAAIGAHAPALPLGHPRHDEVTGPDFAAAARARFGGLLRAGKPVVTYAPTWGNLSSFEIYFNELQALATDFNLLVKLHHNTLAREGDRVRRLQAAGVGLIEGEADLMALIAVSDLVISDYSGAIFDAVMMGRPVVLADCAPEALAASRKTDAASPEIALRDRLGLRAPPGGLRHAIDRALAGRAPQGALPGLFETAPGRTAAMLQALADLAADRIVASPAQAEAMRRVRARMARGIRRRRAILAAVAALILVGVLFLLARAWD